MVYGMSTQNDPAVNQPKVAQSATGETPAAASGEPLEPVATPPPAVRTTPAPPYAWLAWLVFAALIVGVAGAAIYQQLQKSKLGPELPVLGTVPPVALLNEKGTTVTLETFAGQPWVADFIFTRCGGQCPLMTQRMAVLQGWLKEKGLTHVQLVSGTVDPEFDTPERLAEYGNTFKADPEMWTFLTGPRETIYPWITEGFKLGVDENKGKPVADMFVHSDRSVLVDAQGRIRGYYVLANDEDMRKIQSAIRRLESEMRQGKAQGG